MTEQKIFSILLTGFLGSGKTTLLSYLLQHPEFAECKVAVLVNDFGSLAVDGALLPEGEHYVAEINNGSIFCICVKVDLMKNLEYIATVIKPDILFIEATGVAEPTAFTSLLQSDLLRSSFGDNVTLCLADALNFPKLVTILPALTAQVQLADLVVVNKCDLADDAELNAVETKITALNPGAEIIRAEYGQIEFTETSIRALGNSSISTLADRLQLCSEAPEETVSYEFRSDKNIDRLAFYQLLDRYRNLILRGKGIIEFPDGRFYVEVVNGVISSKAAGTLNIHSGHRNALSFVIRHTTLADEFQAKCEALGSSK
ncbi:MAG: CobW family GTP-binding protein [Victivallaceae bacterium]|nr:CobW family GTP-binding protein [Victivallaceae bacterium]